MLVGNRALILPSFFIDFEMLLPWGLFAGNSFIVGSPLRSPCKLAVLKFIVSYNNFVPR